MASLLAAAALVVTGLLLPAQAWAAAPGVPAAPTLTADSQSLVVSWEAPAAGGSPVTGYLVRVLDQQGAQVAFRRVAGDVLRHTFSGLDNGTYTAVVAALSADGSSADSASSGAQLLQVSTLARWSLAGLPSTAAGTQVPDASGSNNPATIRGTGVTAVTTPGGDGALQLPGGANGSGAGHVQLPTGLLNGRDTVSFSAWIKNETGPGDYAAMFYGTTENLPSRYWLLNPQTNGGRVKSVMTTGTTSTSAPWGTETGFTPTTGARGVVGPAADAGWSLYTTVITPTSISTYLNGTKAGTVAHTTSLATFPTDLVGYLGRSSYPDKFAKGAFRDVRVYGTALSDATVAALWAEEQGKRDLAELAVPATASADLTLPTTGTRASQVYWTSSAPAVISPSGAVTRPQGRDETVTLTAVASSGGKQAQRSFTVTVPAVDDQGDVDRARDGFDLGITRTAGDVVLRTSVDGVQVAWASSAPGVVADDGTVTRGDEARTATLTATFTRGAARATRTFDVVVLARDTARLATYIRSGNENRTDAVHLATTDTPSGAGATYTALNNNRPVLYGPDPETKLGGPTVFRRPDGGFGLLATVDSSSTTAWVWDSVDLVRFTNPREVVLNTAGQRTASVRAAWDNGIRAYRLTYTSGGTTYEVRTADFRTVGAPTVVSPAAAEPSATFPATALEASTTPLTAAELAVLTRKLTRQVNTGTKPVADVTVPQGGTVTLPPGVTATYSNGGADTQLPVTWDADDVAAVDPQRPGTYTVRGTVRPTSYPGTIGEQRADPDVTRGDDGRYYMTASYPQNGTDNADGYNRVNLRVADTIAGLATAPETTIWHENTSALNRYVWAPELTKIKDTWYVLFTASRSGNLFDIRPMMLRHTGGSLVDPASWVEVGAMLPAAGDSAFSSFSLDMTHFELGGKDYVVWAEKPGPSQLRIAQVDSDDPRQLVSPSRVIATPDTAWEVNLGAGQRVDEGAAVIQRGGRLLMTFSGSTVDDRYSVGLLSASASADPLDPASWTKTAYPLLVTEDLASEPTRQSGPGHNSFTTDELGNTVIVYHSRDLASTTNGGLEDPSRWARARTVHFDADGDPVLNMTPAEELRPENAATSVRVVVTPASVTAPGAPGTPVVSDVTDSGATVSWTAPTSTGGQAPTAYGVTVTQGATTVSSTSVTGTTTTLSGLAAGQAYTVSVTATNSGGTGPAATSAPFTTASLPAATFRYPLDVDLREEVAGRTATAVGDVGFTADGLALPGGTSSSTGYVALPDDLLTGLGEDLTVSVWVRSDTPARDNSALSFGTPTQANGLPANYWILNPTGRASQARSVMTNGVSTSAPYNTEVSVTGPETASRRGQWVNYTTVFTAGTLTAYVDGARVGSVAKSRTFAQFAAAGTLKGYLGRSGYVNDPAFKGAFRDLQVFGSALTASQVRLLDAQDGFVLDAARTRLGLGDTSAVQGDLTLPTTLGDDVEVSWATSDASVVSAQGRVTVAATTRSADLTATLTRGGQSTTKVFRVSVVGRDTVVRRAADLLVAASTLASGDSLPVVGTAGVTTTWSTTTPGLAVDGAVVTATARTTGQLTARVSADGVEPVTKTFTVTVLPADQAHFLLGYTRTPLATQVYGPNVAHALHLALGAARQGVTPLNGNTGVLFARGVPSATTEITDIRTLVTPHLFRTADGGWGAVAVRTLSGGTPDSSAATSMLLFTSPDLLTWTERGTVAVDTAGAGVRQPAVVWDSAAQRYLVSWTSASGTAWTSHTTDLTDPAAFSAPQVGTPVVNADQATTGATGAVPGNTVVVEPAQATALRHRWGRITNTGSSVAPVTVPGGGDTSALGSTRATLTYDDGSTATRGVDWDAADLAAVDPSRPGTYTVDGTVRQTDYAFPFITGRADPSIFRWKGRYLFLATNADESAFNLRSATTITGLQSAPDNRVLGQGVGLAGPLWAPELHEIDGDLWVFFASGVEERAWHQVQAHVMKLRSPDADPTLASSWETPRLVQEQQGGRLQLDADHPGISLDMTYFTDTRGGEVVHYVAWSQRYRTAQALGDAQMWIATIDPADPSRLTSDPVLFNAPDLGWDHNTSGVVEAPFVIRRGDRLVMTYSGSNIDNTYAIGQLSAPAGADLLDPTVWTKQNDPLLVSDAAGRQAGPGHSMFTTDEDGNTVLVYHARTNGGGSRDTGLRRIHWGVDDRLVLDMTKDEEVAPANRVVTMTVTVQAGPVIPPVTPPVVLPPVVVPPVVLPPVLVPLLPPVSLPEVRLGGRAQGVRVRAGRPARLVITMATDGPVRVKAGGRKQTVQVIGGRAVVKVRFAQPGRKKVVVRSAAGKVVEKIRVRR